MTTSFMHAAFFTNIDVDDISCADGKAPLVFRWNRAMKIEFSKCTKVSRGYAGYKTVIKDHLKKEHPHTKLPYLMYKVDDRKKGGKNEGDVVEYKDFISSGGERMTNVMTDDELNAFFQNNLEQTDE